MKIQKKLKNLLAEIKEDFKNGYRSEMKINSYVILEDALEERKEKYLKRMKNPPKKQSKLLRTRALVGRWNRNWLADFCN